MNKPEVLEYAISFALNLRTIRKRFGLTQRHLADAIGKEHSMISHMEAGRRLPSVNTLLEIAVTLHTDPGDFFKDPAQIEETTE